MLTHHSVARTADIGAMGEEIAAQHLLSEGFEILERNWRSGRYELDIVAVGGGELHVVEVKCRRRGGLTRPEEAINAHKARAVMKAAEEYLAQKGLDMDVRFDVIAVEYDAGGHDLRYIPDAMVCSW